MFMTLEMGILSILLRRFRTAWLNVRCVKKMTLAAVCMYLLTAPCAYWHIGQVCMCASLNFANFKALQVTFRTLKRSTSETGRWWLFLSLVHWLLFTRPTLLAHPQTSGAAGLWNTYLLLVMRACWDVLYCTVCVNVFLYSYSICLFLFFIKACFLVHDMICALAINLNNPICAVYLYSNSLWTCRHVFTVA